MVKIKCDYMGDSFNLIQPRHMVIYWDVKLHNHKRKPTKMVISRDIYNQ